MLATHESKGSFLAHVTHPLWPGGGTQLTRIIKGPRWMEAPKASCHSSLAKPATQLILIPLGVKDGPAMLQEDSRTGWIICRALEPCSHIRLLPTVWLDLFVSQADLGRPTRLSALLAPCSNPPTVAGE